MRREPSPADRSRQAKLIQMRRIVIRDSPSENKALPRTRRNFETLQLAQHFERSMLAPYLRSRSNMLPAQQPIHELRRRDRFDLLAQSRHRQAMNARQQSPFAPLDLDPCLREERVSDPFPAAAQRGAVRRAGTCPRRIAPLASIRSRAFSISEAASPSNAAQFRSGSRPQMRHPSPNRRQQRIVAINDVRTCPASPPACPVAWAYSRKPRRYSRDAGPQTVSARSAAIQYRRARIRSEPLPRTPAARPATAQRSRSHAVELRYPPKPET